MLSTAVLISFVCFLTRSLPRLLFFPEILEGDTLFHLTAARWVKQFGWSGTLRRTRPYPLGFHWLLSKIPESYLVLGKN